MQTRAFQKCKKHWAVEPGNEAKVSSCHAFSHTHHCYSTGSRCADEFCRCCSGEPRGAEGGKGGGEGGGGGVTIGRVGGTEHGELGAHEGTAVDQ